MSKTSMQVAARLLARCTRAHVVVPSRTRADRRLSLRHWTQRFIDCVVPLSGGATTVHGCGYWLDARGQCISERVCLVDFAFSHPLGAQQARVLLGRLTDLAARMEQEVLALTVEGRLLLLEITVPSTLVRESPRSQVKQSAAAPRRIREGGMLRTG
jgi:hypothetical protein